MFLSGIFCMEKRIPAYLLLKHMPQDAKIFGGTVKTEKNNYEGRQFLSKLETAVGHCSMIEVHGDRELLLSGCKGIVDYDNAKIVINTLSGQVVVCGFRLCLSVFRGDILRIEGHITEIKFGGDAE